MRFFPPRGSVFFIFLFPISSTSGRYAQFHSDNIITYALNRAFSIVSVLATHLVMIRVERIGTYGSLFFVCEYSV